MGQAQEFLYAIVGVSDLTVEKVRNISTPDSKATQKFYKDVVKRGRSLTQKISTSAPTKQAIAQTKTARTQVRAAATSIGKAVQASTSGSSAQAREQAKTARSQAKGAATSVTKAVRANAKAARSAATKVSKASQAS